MSDVRYYTASQMREFKSFDGSIEDYNEHIRKNISEFETILWIVCSTLRVPAELPLRKSSSRASVVPRQIIHWFCYYFTLIPLDVIGKKAGVVDHATVLHACRTVNNLQETDKQFKLYIEELEKKIKL